MPFAQGSVIFLVILGIASVAVVLRLYNTLVILRHQVERSWANLDVVLAQRFSEFPQLIEAIEPFVLYEREWLEEISAGRAHYLRRGPARLKVKEAAALDESLVGLIALKETYPDLKANHTFMAFQKRVTDLETQIADRREHFNATATLYNQRLEQFPELLFAFALGLQPFDLYHPAAPSRKAL